MSKSSIVDSRLWIRLDFDSSLKPNSFFKVNPSNRAHFASQLLLYDTIVIPTKDFGIIPIIISWMGLKPFREALENQSIKFIRPSSMIGYAGNGTGISAFEIKPGLNSPYRWNQEAMFGLYEDTADIQIKYQCPFIQRLERNRIVKLIYNCSIPFSWSKDDFDKNIIKESNTDILSNSVLSKFILQFENSSNLPKKLNKLSGIKPNQMRVLGMEGIKDGIDLLLRVSEINLEIMMAHLFHKSDLSTSKGAEILLVEKIRRSGLSKNLVDQFQQLLDLENIPDIRPAIESGNLSLSEIWTLRNKRKARNFRKWLRIINSQNTKDLVKAYINALGKSSIYSSLPARTIKLVFTVGIDIAAPGIGTLLNTTDSFFVEKWVKGYNPKLFLDEIRKLPFRGNHSV